MKKPNNYENTAAYGSFEPLELGGHVCKVCKVVESVSRTGKDMVDIWLDIAEGPQKDYYLKQWKADTRDGKKWPCIVYQLVEDSDGNTSRGYKTFLESVKKSNPGFVEDRVWEDTGCEYLKGKLVGGVFGREQYMNQRGEHKVRAVPGCRNHPERGGRAGGQASSGPEAGLRLRPCFRQ